MNLIWIDTETTGLDPFKHGIVELGAIIDGRPVKHFNRICDPGDVVYDPKALEVNGISLEEIKSRPSIEEMLREFDQHVWDRAIIAGHNVAGFDIPFLKEAYRRAGLKWRFHYHCVDPMVLANVLKHWGLLDTRSLSLGGLAEHFGIDPGNAHRALDDIKTTKAIMEAMHERISGTRKLGV